MKSWVIGKPVPPRAPACRACGKGRPSQYVVYEEGGAVLWKALCHRHRLKKAPDGMKLMSRREFREWDALKAVMEA